MSIFDNIPTEAFQSINQGLSGLGQGLFMKSMVNLEKEQEKQKAQNDLFKSLITQGYPLKDVSQGTIIPEVMRDNEQIVNMFDLTKKSTSNSKGLLFSDVNKNVFLPGSEKPLPPELAQTLDYSKYEVRSIGGLGANVELTDADRKNQSLINRAKMLYEGRATPSQIANLRTPDGQKLVALTSELYPKDWDVTQVVQRQKTRNSYSPGGKDAENLKSINTILGHLDTASENVKRLDNVKLRKANTFINYFKRESSNPTLKRINLDILAITNEAARMFQTGIGVITESERLAFRESLNNADSIEAMQATIDEMIDLAKSRTDAIKFAWQESMGELPTPVPILNQKSKGVLIKRGYGPDTMEKTGAGLLGIGNPQNTGVGLLTENMIKNYMDKFGWARDEVIRRYNAKYGGQQ